MEQDKDAGLPEEWIHDCARHLGELLRTLLESAEKMDESQ
jgi:hypothetical protein